VLSGTGRLIPCVTRVKLCSKICVTELRAEWENTLMLVQFSSVQITPYRWAHVLTVPSGPRR